MGGAILGFQHVDAGLWHSLAVAADGTVHAWGVNDYGQLAIEPVILPPPHHAPTPSSGIPVRVAGLSEVTQVAAGFFHSLALRADGTVWAWGRNEHGQLGDGTTQRHRSVPAQVLGVSEVVAIAAGWGHSLALRADGTVWAWGYNGQGQLAVGVSHTVAIRSDGTLWGWGSNLLGQLGDGTNTFRPNPVQVRAANGSVQVDAGGHHTVVVVERQFGRG